MNIDDQEFLNQIEQNIRSKDNNLDDARRESEQRAHEMERIRKASALKTSQDSKPVPVQAKSKSNELENDPRYKQYFERLKRQKGITTPAAGSPTIEDEPQAGSERRSAGAESQTVGPGSIVRFDDGSIGIYKDAVSGRDYALFYFLQPDGQFSPMGVFLQCYQAKALGTLPENYFNKLREENTWNRDLVLYHLSSFEHVDYLNNLAEHEDRKPKNTTPARNASVPPSPSESVSASNTSGTVNAPSTSSETTTANNPATAAISSEYRSKSIAEPIASKESGGLVAGQKFVIKFGGKKWEAVYWSRDGDGTIVAHSTHGHWSLMRLDLERFKDSLEVGEVVGSEVMNAIAKDAAASK